MARNFQLDRVGGAEVLKDLSARAIADLGQQVAAAAGSDAEVELSTSDRARAVVKVPADQQAIDGVLSKAAASVGVEVRPSKRTSQEVPARANDSRRKARSGRKS